MGWVRDKIDEIGMQRFLQDMVNEIDAIPDQEPYLWRLHQDLEMALQDCEARNDKV